MIYLPVCEICENEAVQIEKCKGCGIKFCEKCGDRERNMCEDCLDYAGAFESGTIEDMEESD